MFRGIFSKREKSSDFVDLSIGRVYYFVLTGKVIDEAMVVASIANNQINNALFFRAMERRIVDLPKHQMDKLGVNDFNKLRTKTKEIMKRYGIIEDRPELETGFKFAQQDIEWFDKQKQQVMNGIKQ